MRVKYADPSKPVRDPVTKLHPHGEGDAAGSFEVPDNTFWHRRLRDGDVVRVSEVPTGREPLVPLTTR